MLPRRKTKIQLHSLTVSSAGAEFLYYQWPILFAYEPIRAVSHALYRHQKPSRKRILATRAAAKLFFTFRFG
ncbi:hypothetical protein GIV52_19355 [Pseudomonas syringae]|uniref:Uncharacterized protein n=1 Tax=Pseudomonas syringae TaxID=317 RepID=A0A9Q4A2U5_PSESX|nr:hypothetical protein [Pseudomonas syringae]MCF5472877.1 hypothetical protein [Pseudomonas syringae]MCF5482892.1 hypothetical protein [Pseudomonas syringae]MCF5489342.1 hypothetical protein [Pseudomonas syringae]MCF5491775.1 hypothetical protein [Pseudomonas syringae]